MILICLITLYSLLSISFVIGVFYLISKSDFTPDEED